MLLYNYPNDIIIDLKDNSLISNNIYIDLLSGISSDTVKINATTDFIIIHSGITIVLDNFRENGVSKETELGTITLWYGDSEYSIYIDGDEYYTESIGANTSLRIRTTKNDKLLDDVRFEYTVDSESKSVNISAVSR